MQGLVLKTVGVKTWSHVLKTVAVKTQGHVLKTVGEKKKGGFPAIAGPENSCVKFYS